MCIITIPGVCGAQTVTLQQWVSNPEMDRPVEGALVEVMHDGSVIASGTTDEDGLAEITFSATSVPEPSERPDAFEVSTYPNPFVGSATVELRNPVHQDVTISAYTLLGQRIAETRAHLAPGVYTSALSLGPIARQPVLVVVDGAHGRHSLNVMYMGGSGTFSLQTPQFRSSLSGTSQPAQLFGYVYETVTYKAGYSSATTSFSLGSGDEQTVALQVQKNPLVPQFVGELSVGGLVGEEVCVSESDLSSLVDASSVDNIDVAFSLESNSSGLTIDDYCFTATAGGNHSFTVRAESAVGGVSSQTEDYVVTPTTVVRVENSDSRDVPAGNIAYLVVGADSLFSSSGVFEGIPVGSAIKAGFKNAVGAYSSFVRGAVVELDNSVLAQGSESGFYVRPFDFYLRDENYVVVDSLSRTGGELVENVVGFRNWIDVLWLSDSGHGVTPWNIQDISPSTPNTFNFFTQSENGRGPESLIIPDIIYVENTDISHYLDDHTRNLMINTVENHVFPYMGFNGVFAPPIVQPDSISFLATDNQYMNHMILAARNNMSPGVFGTIGVYGEAPNNIYNTFARIRSPPSPNDHTMIRAISQEMMAAAIMNTIPANPASLPEALATANQSILHNSTNLITPSIYDIKVLRFVWEPTYVGAVTDVIELPEEYDL